ncbi:MAG TPA: FAD-binding oxidoreductase, partial [Candidatus Hodarchaeales archaeon]|nr:FAD-binding oxidoreductase [Candidatus Hodarchaeales archaeon]
ITDPEKRILQASALERNSFPIKIPNSRISFSEFRELEGIPDLTISIDPQERLRCSHGMSYWDLLRIRNGKIPNVADAVAKPSTDAAINSLISVAHHHRIPLIPIGGRTGVTEATNIRDKAIVVDLQRMNHVVEFIPSSCLAIVEAGILLPDLEKWLGERNYRFGHSPQSFLSASVGGSIAARGAGQFSSIYGHIGDMISDLEVLTPVGTFRNRNNLVPESAAGPDLNEIFVGSEGALGIIAKAGVKIHPIQTIQFVSFLFKSFEDGLKAISEFYQKGVRPAVIRLSDKEETGLFLDTTLEGRQTHKAFLRKMLSSYLWLKGSVLEGSCLLLLVFDGHTKINSASKKIASSISKRNGAIPLGSVPAKRWYKERYELPFYRDTLMSSGILVDTLETAARWDKLPELYKKVTEELRKMCPIVTAHVSHVYDVGAAIYFTFMVLETYDWHDPLVKRIRKKIVDIFLNSATISHHHGVGSAFSEFLVRERPLLANELVSRIKLVLDPKGIMNPSAGLVYPNSDQHIWPQ